MNKAGQFLSKLKDSISVEEFYRRLIGKLPSPNPETGEVKISCPFHVDRLGKIDSTPSMGINLLTHKSGIYNCPGCGASGQMIGFYVEWHKLKGVEFDSPTEIARSISEFYGLSSFLEKQVLDVNKLDGWAEHLQTQEKPLDELHNLRHLSDEVIQEFRLGWDAEEKRVTIPIFDESETLHDIKRWLPHYMRALNPAAIKSVSLTGRWTVLYPYTQLKYDTLIVCEGELDCLALISLGFNAITSTHGVGSLAKVISPKLKAFIDKEIILMVDADEAGETEVEKLLDLLFPVASSIKCVFLPPDQDVTDFIHTDPASAKIRLHNLIDNTIPYEKIVTANDKVFLEVSLYSGIHERYINKAITLMGTIISQSTEPIGIARSVMCKCSGVAKGCFGCPKFGTNDSKRRTLLPLLSPVLLELTSATTKMQDSIMREFLGILGKTKCNGKLEVDEFQTLEELKLVPDMDFTSDEFQWITRKAFYVGTGLQINGTYKFFGKTVIHPETSEVVYLLDKAEPINQSLDSFPEIILSTGEHAEIFHQLEKFRVVEGWGVAGKLASIYEDLERNITKVINRRDVLQAVDLTYHTPRSFVLRGEAVTKGWGDCLIIGDTQCGKSVTCYRYREHCRLGGIVDGQLTTAVGLAGGFVDGSGNRKMYQLGTLSLNDKKLIMIDEGITQEILKQLRMIRTSGVIVTTKLASQHKSYARTRLIMISNPASGLPLSFYHYGILAVRELIKDEADIARFDLCVAVSSEEVSLQDINAPLATAKEIIYDSDSANLLLRWVWSRVSSNWRFTPEAETAILQAAVRMGEIYSPMIPLVLGANHRVKVAKIAAAVAARVFSTDDGVNVIINTEHVEAAVDFMEGCYRKKQLGYYQYSEDQHVKENITHPSTLKSLLDVNDSSAAEFFKIHSSFTKDMFTTSTGIDPYLATQLFARLSQVHAIDVRKNTQYVTRGFRDFLGEYQHPNPSKWMAEVDRATEMEKLSGDDVAI